MNTSDMEGVKTKVCSKCKIEKPVEEFSKDKKRRGGLHYWCKECEKEYQKEYQKEYRKANSEYQKEWKKANPGKIQEYNKDYRKANPDKIQEYNKDYRKANPESSKEWRKANPEYNKEWRKANPDKKNAHNAKRRSKKLQATPPWLTKEHLSAIRMYYTESKALEKGTGIKHHVDHIVPLQGENVCGLHVPWNLQVLTASENSAKSNHYPDE